MRWKTDKRLRITGNDKTRWCIYATRHVPAVTTHQGEVKQQTVGGGRPSKTRRRDKRSIIQADRRSIRHRCVSFCLRGDLKGRARWDGKLHIPAGSQKRCHSDSLMPQLWVFIPFQISELGVYMGLSAGSSHLTTLELFTDWRLQPFQGMRWVGVEGWTEEAEKERDTGPEKLQTVDGVCVCVNTAHMHISACLRKPSMCFFLVRLIKASALSIRLHVCSRDWGSCHLSFTLLLLWAPVAVLTYLSGFALKCEKMMDVEFVQEILRDKRTRYCL